MEDVVIGSMVMVMVFSKEHIMNTAITGGNNLMITSAFIFDCSTGKGRGDLMKI